MYRSEYVIIGDIRFLQRLRKLLFKDSSICMAKIQKNLEADRCRIFDQEFEIPKVNLKKGSSCLIVKEQDNAAFKINLIKKLFPFIKITGVPLTYLLCSTEYRRRNCGKRYRYKTLFKDMEFYNGFWAVREM